MLNFKKVFEFLFKSFDISWDTKLLEKLEKDWLRFLMVIKRHWMYSVLNLWIVFIVLIITIINLIILFKWDIISKIIWIFLALNIIYWIVIVFLYIFRFYKINWNYPYIEDIYSSINKSRKSDEVFTKFFNQTIFLFLLLFSITLFSVINSIMYIINWWAFWFWAQILNVFLLIVELILFYSFLLKMINQEMDFKVIVPGQILFFDQKWVLSDSQSMNANKIKTLNTEYSWFLWSFFNYWNIIILSEWDQGWNWEMKMNFIWNPQNTVKEIEKVLKNDIQAIEKDVNIVLQKLKSELQIDNENKENLIKLKEYVRKNEQKIKELFENGDEETRKEIRELYVLINN